jgi:hypothetical protein
MHNLGGEQRLGSGCCEVIAPHQRSQQKAAFVQEHETCFQPAGFLNRRPSPALPSTALRGGLLRAPVHGVQEARQYGQRVGPRNVALYVLGGG